MHLSDLHFGDRDRRHLEPHDPQLLEGLTAACRRLHRHVRVPRATPLHFVVTGDVTAGAGETAFDAALAFLTGRVQLGHAAARVGLGLEFGPGGDLSIVPGDRDHGRIAVASPAGLDPTLRLPSPWKTTLVSSDRRLTVVLFGINTDSGRLDRGPAGRSRNCGEIAAAEVAWLELELARTPAEALRAIVMHHDLEPMPAVAQTAATPAADRPPWPLAQRDKARLAALAGQYRVDVVLTGHRHWPTSAPRAIPGPGAVLHELRAPATLRQASTTAKAVGWSGLPGFLVHHVHRAAGGRRTWKTHLFLWHRGAFRLWRQAFEELEM
ncbi:MAG: metallophosphoesterase [Planctomycetes bacterium]|nr:metallophosphoesterase [Planctomycetota bacterium]